MIADKATPPLQLRPQPIHATFPANAPPEPEEADLLAQLNAPIEEGASLTREYVGESPEEVAEKSAALTEEAQLTNMFRLAKRVSERIVAIPVPDPEDPSKDAFVFHVHPITDAQFEAIRRDRDVSTYTKTPVGVEVISYTDEAKFRSALIVNATIPADQERIWRNRTLLLDSGAISSVNLVDLLLPSGYKEVIAAKIEQISGYRDQKTRERILGE